MLQWQTPAGRVATMHHSKALFGWRLCLSGGTKTSTEVPRMNSITIVGHVGNDPQSKTFEDTGNQVVRFSLAVREYSPNADKAKPLWIEVDAWNEVADRVLKAITKGREVAIQGRLAINTYTKELKGGATVQMTKPVIKLTNFHLCGPKPRSSHDSLSAEAIDNTR
jgi:single-strand DNA-binding protein